MRRQFLAAVALQSQNSFQGTNVKYKILFSNRFQWEANFSSERRLLILKFCFDPISLCPCYPYQQVRWFSEGLISKQTMLNSHLWEDCHCLPFQIVSVVYYLPLIDLRGVSRLILHTQRYKLCNNCSLLPLLRDEMLFFFSLKNIMKSSDKEDKHLRRVVCFGF